MKKKLLKYGIPAGTVVFIAVIILVALKVTAPRPAVAVSFTARDVSINSMDGTVSRVSIAPSGIIFWNDFDTAQNTATVIVWIEDKTDTLRKIQEESIAIDTPRKHGIKTFKLPKQDITDATDYPTEVNTNNIYLLSDFESAVDGRTKEVPDIKVKVKAIVSGVSGEASDTFMVATTNKANSVKVSGRANTNGVAGY